jgi:hypothetical protein
MEEWLKWLLPDLLAEILTSQWFWGLVGGVITTYWARIKESVSWPIATVYGLAVLAFILLIAGEVQRREDHALLKSLIERSNQPFERRLNPEDEKLEEIFYQWIRKTVWSPSSCPPNTVERDIVFCLRVTTSKLPFNVFIYQAKNQKEFVHFLLSGQKQNLSKSAKEKLEKIPEAEAKRLITDIQLEIMRQGVGQTAIGYPFPQLRNMSLSVSAPIATMTLEKFADHINLLFRTIVMVHAHLYKHTGLEIAETWG